MDAKQNGYEPAYPGQLVEDRHGEMVPASNFADVGGLTKRERFAMAAMQGICAGSAHGNPDYKQTARQARIAADALLAELAKEPQ